MRWRKLGLTYTPPGSQPWALSHAQVPTGCLLEDGRLRVYFGTRDAQNRTVTTFVDVAANEPTRVLYVHDRPVLGLGALGCFDDCGAMPSWAMARDGQLFLYYTGWNTSTTVPYRNSIGVAVSDDGGLSFRRPFQGPILDRTHLEPHLCATPCVLPAAESTGDRWHMWYLGGTGWSVVNGRAEPHYNVRHATSPDGFTWQRRGEVAIDFASPDEAGIARPSVLVQDGRYRMWYSHRGAAGYREGGIGSYRLGYAESADGITWTRHDVEAGLDVSPDGWDSEMVAYPYIYAYGGRLYLLYNGNGFGRSGFGCAVLDE